MIVKEEATSICGTTAYLKPGDQVSYLQLLYGMMLPSGNDAAYTLAQNFGMTLLNTKYEGYSTIKRNKIKSFMFPNNVISFFLHEMNIQAKELGMIESYFDSPHGLSNKNNVSTINDLAKLTLKCMQIPLFRQIVGTSYLETYSFNPNKKTRYRWKSSNKLLGTTKNAKTGKLVPICEGTKGCKTGITDSAGCCFAGYFERDIDG